MTLAIQQAMDEITRLWNVHNRAVYVDGDVEAAVRVLHEECRLVHVPVGTGGTDRDAVARYLARDVVPHLPADLEFRRAARTLDQRRLVEEQVVTFTHDRELPWLLPGAAPTHRAVEVSAIVTVSARHRSHQGKTTTSIIEHRTLWDYFGLLAQLGLSAGDVRVAA